MGHVKSARGLCKHARTWHVKLTRAWREKDLLHFSDTTPTTRTYFLLEIEKPPALNPARDTSVFSPSMRSWTCRAPRPGAEPLRSFGMHRPCIESSTLRRSKPCELLPTPPSCQEKHRSTPSPLQEVLSREFCEAWSMSSCSKEVVARSDSGVTPSGSATLGRQGCLYLWR